MTTRPLTPMESEAVDQWLRRNRCCGSPSACGATCFDDEESWTTTLVVREFDRLRDEVSSTSTARLTGSRGEVA